MPQQNFDRPTIIYFHENSGNLSDRLDFFELLYKSLRVNIYAVSYRGYGFSKGNPSEKGLQKDCKAVIKYATTNINTDPTNIFVLGRSLGGAVAIYSAFIAQDLLRGIIIENTFTSMNDLVDEVLPYFSFIKTILLKSHWPNLNIIKELQIPILFISGTQDELIPACQMMKLFNSANNSKYKEFV